MQCPCFYFLLAVVLALPPIFITMLPAYDTAARYAPMAQAFAAGDWAYAFHPRIPPLFPILGGGLVWLLRCDAFMGVRLASLLLFALSVFPLFALFRRFLPLKATCFGMLFYLFCHPLLQYVYEGLRDNGKTLAFALAAWALLSLWESPRRWRYYLILGCAVALGALFRAELLVILGALFIVSAVRECCKKQIPYRTILGGIVALLLLTPVAAINYHFTKIPVVDVRLIGFLPDMAQRATENIQRNKSLSVPAEAPPPIEHRDLTTGEYLNALFAGFYPPYLAAILLGAAWRLKRKEWQTQETVLAGIVLGNAIITALLILLGERYLYLSKRYLLPALPLAFGWGGYFAVSLWNFCREHYRKWFPVTVAVLIFVVCAGLLYGAALGALVRNVTSKKAYAKNRAVFECAESIKQDYQGSRRGERVFLLNSYRSNLRPFVVAPPALDLSPALAGGSRVFSNHLADYIVMSSQENPPSSRWRRVAEIVRFRHETFVIWGRSHTRGKEK